MVNEPINDLVQVSLSNSFKDRFKRFSPQARRLISSFIAHVKNFGFDNLPGRNKFSDDIDTNSPNFLHDVRLVNEHCLWHYHLGYYEYDESKPHGDKTSMFVLHYSRQTPSEILIVDFGPHPPFKLPLLSMLT